MAKKQLKPQTMLAPVPAALISCGREGEEPNIITLAWVGVVCSDPPMISIAVRPGRYSYDIIKDTGEFVVNLPLESQAAIVDGCGLTSGRKVHKFRHFHLTPQRGALKQAPVIAECPINLECVVRQFLPLGVHHLFLGEVVGVQVDENLCDERGKVDTRVPLLGYTAAGQYLGIKPLDLGYGFSAKK